MKKSETKEPKVALWCKDQKKFLYYNAGTGLGTYIAGDGSKEWPAAAARKMCKMFRDLEMREVENG